MPSEKPVGSTDALQLIAAYAVSTAQNGLFDQVFCCHEQPVRVMGAIEPTGQPFLADHPVNHWQVALRVGLPVFVKSKNGKSAPKMEWSVLHKTDGHLAVVLHNPGSAHIQVSDFSLLMPGSNALVASEQGSNYVLAGQPREWNLRPITPENRTAARLRLKVFTDAGDADQELPLDRQ
jgi:P pilus assembly chaperone PapD